MGIIRVKHNSDFVVMNKTGLEDPELSFKAKGLLAYLLSKPDNWKANISHLSTVSKDGKSAVASGLKELEKNGYLQREATRNEDGTIKEWESTIFEIPVNPPEPENPEVDNPKQENRQVINNELINNELNNKTNNNKSQKISKKYKQVFQKELSLETYNKLIAIYKDLNIIYKAILVAEERTKGIPAVSYLFKTLENWSNKDLTDISNINTYLEQRQAKKSHRSPNKSNQNNKASQKLHNRDKLEDRGWNS